MHKDTQELLKTHDKNKLKPTKFHSMTVYVISKYLTSKITDTNQDSLGKLHTELSEVLSR